MIDQTQRQRVLGADNGQADLLLLREGDEAVELLQRRLDGDVLAVLGGAGVAGRTVDALDARRQGQLPDESVLAPSLADDQDLHRGPSAPGKCVPLTLYMEAGPLTTGAKM